MTRTKRTFTFCTLEKLHVLRGLPERATKNQTFLGEIACSPRTSRKGNKEPNLLSSRASCRVRRLHRKEPKLFRQEPEGRIRLHRHPRALNARRPFAKARTRRSTHPRRAIHVREIVAPVRTRKQRPRHSPRRSDRPTNSRPSFPKAKAKPRPAPDIRSRSSPASTNAV